MSEPPTGFGVYLRSLSTRVHGTPAQAATRALRRKVSWVALMAFWQDHRGHLDKNGSGEASMLVQYARAFRRANIRVWLWGYPETGMETEATRRLRRVTDECGEGVVAGWLLDPEAGYKWGKRFDRTEVQARGGAVRLVELTLDNMDEHLGVGITSYGAAHWHKEFPWDVFGGFGFGSPQTYTMDDGLIFDSMAAWRDLGWKALVPSVAAYGPNSERIGECMSAHGPAGRNFCVWSWRQLDRDEWREFKEAAR